MGELLGGFPKTVELALAAMTLATLCGLTLGVVASLRPGGLADRIAMLGAYLGVSFPVYWVGLVLIFVFAIALRWFPPSGYGGRAYLVPPPLSVGVRSNALVARVMRRAAARGVQH